MPWQNQGGGGPWGGGGGGGQGPWGGRGGGGGGGGTPPPDLEEMLRRSQDRIKNIFPGGGSIGKLLPLLILVIAVICRHRLPSLVARRPSSLSTSSSPVVITK